MTSTIFYNNSNNDNDNICSFLFSRENREKIPSMNKTMYNILNLFYIQSNEINQILDKMYQRPSFIQRELYDLSKHKNFLTDIELLKSKYISHIIQKDIYENYHILFTNHIQLEERKVHIHFILKEETHLEMYNFDRIIRNILFILLFLSLYETENVQTPTLTPISKKTSNINKCSNELNINIVLSDYHKCMPPTDLKPNKTIFKPHYINNAITTTCSKEGEILIYRQEELFKVLIHELFHNIGLDFSSIDIDKLKQRLREIFHIDSSYLLYESYCEFWGLFLHTFFYTLFQQERKQLIDKNNMFDIFVQDFEMNIKTEILFSLYQSIKLLDTLDITYEMIVSNNINVIQERKKQYKEETNVLMYYIIKSIFIFFYSDFINCLLQQNNSILSSSKDSNELMKIVFFIERKKDTAILELYKKITKEYKNMKINQTYLISPFHKTLQNSYYSISLLS